MTTGLNRLIVKLIFVFVLLSVAATGFTATTALQVDFLLSGMRDPETDEPLNGGLVYFYDSGTTSSETVYLDRDKTSESTNPVVLDAYGRAVVFVDGVVDVTVTNASGTTVWSDTGLDYQNVVSGTTFTTFTQNVDAAGYKLFNMADPTANQDAATKLYVDTEITSTEALITALESEVATLTYLDLVDTPLSYSGSTNYFVRVNDDSDGLEFIDLDTVLPANATQAAPIGDAGGDLDGTYPDPAVVALQGTPVGTASPTTNQVLTYNGTAWAPAVVPGGLVRTDAFTGFSNSVTLTQGVDYTGTPIFASVVYDFAGDAIAMFDVEQAAGVGYYRIINRGGESADRNYDGSMTVSTTATSVTLGGRYIKSVILYCQ